MHARQSRAPHVGAQRRARIFIAQVLPVGLCGISRCTCIKQHERNKSRPIVFKTEELLKKRKTRPENWINKMRVPCLDPIINKPIQGGNVRLQVQFAFFRKGEDL